MRDPYKRMLLLVVLLLGVPLGSALVHVVPNHHHHNPLLAARRRSTIAPMTTRLDAAPCAEFWITSTLVGFCLEAWDQCVAPDAPKSKKHSEDSVVEPEENKGAPDEMSTRTVMSCPLPDSRRDAQERRKVDITAEKLKGASFHEEEAQMLRGRAESSSKIATMPATAFSGRQSSGLQNDRHVEVLAKGTSRVVTEEESLMEFSPHLDDAVEEEPTESRLPETLDTSTRVRPTSSYLQYLQSIGIPVSSVSWQSKRVEYNTGVALPLSDESASLEASPWARDMTTNAIENESANHLQHRWKDAWSSLAGEIVVGGKSTETTTLDFMMQRDAPRVGLNQLATQATETASYLDSLSHKNRLLTRALKTCRTLKNSLSPPEAETLAHNRLDTVDDDDKSARDSLVVAAPTTGAATQTTGGSNLQAFQTCSNSTTTSLAPPSSPPVVAETRTASKDTSPSGWYANTVLGSSKSHLVMATNAWDTSPLHSLSVAVVNTTKAATGRRRIPGGSYLHSLGDASHLWRNARALEHCKILAAAIPVGVAGSTAALEKFVPRRLHLETVAGTSVTTTEASAGHTGLYLEGLVATTKASTGIGPTESYLDSLGRRPWMNAQGLRTCGAMTSSDVEPVASWGRSRTGSLSAVLADTRKMPQVTKRVDGAVDVLGHPKRMDRHSGETIPSRECLSDRTSSISAIVRGRLGQPAIPDETTLATAAAATPAYERLNWTISFPLASEALVSNWTYVDGFGTCDSVLQTYTTGAISNGTTDKTYVGAWVPWGTVLLSPAFLVPQAFRRIASSVLLPPSNLGSNRTEDGSVASRQDLNRDLRASCYPGESAWSDETTFLSKCLPRRQTTPKLSAKRMTPHMWTSMTAPSPSYVSPTPTPVTEPKLHALWGTTLVGGMNERNDKSSFAAPLQRKLRAKAKCAWAYS